MIQKRGGEMVVVRERGEERRREENRVGTVPVL